MSWRKTYTVRRGTEEEEHDAEVLSLSSVSAIDRVLDETSVKRALELTAHDPITLNVGGKRFETYPSTFLAYPDTLLGAMFSERNRSILKANSKGEFFIDRNGETFSAILDFYRTGELIVPSHMPRRLIEIEVEYFQLPVDVELIPPAGSMRGELMTHVAITRAMRRIGSTIDSFVQEILQEAENASVHGCHTCIVDIPKNPSWKRLSSSHLDTRKCYLNTRIWCHNFVRLVYTQLLVDKDNCRLISRRLQTERFMFRFYEYGPQCWSIQFLLWGDRDTTSVRKLLTMHNEHKVTDWGSEEFVA